MAVEMIARLGTALPGVRRRRRERGTDRPAQSVTDAAGSMAQFKRPGGMMPAMQDQKKRWAELGASIRLVELRREEAEILQAFPDVGRAETTSVGSRKKRRLSAWARRAMSAGMRKYWAKRKAAERGGGKA
jgi:hypothetical protein